MDFTTTLDSHNVSEVADLINQAVAAGKTVTVSGVAAQYRYGDPAKSWGTGSLSVKHRARTTNGYNDAWFKSGATITIEGL